MFIGLSKAFRPLQWTFTLPLRPFSPCLNRYAPSKDPEKINKGMTQWQRELLRRAEEPGYREWSLKRRSERERHHLANNPEYRKRLLERSRICNKRRYRDDEEFRAYWSDSRKAKLLKDPEAKKRLNELTLQRYRKKAHDPDFLRRKKLYAWVYNNVRAREQFEFRTHKPILYPERIKHECTTCGYAIIGGLRLWWQRKEDPTKYDCHACFTADWSRVLPIGYENHDFAQGPPTKRFSK